MKRQVFLDTSLNNTFIIFMQKNVVAIRLNRLNGNAMGWESTNTINGKSAWHVLETNTDSPCTHSVPETAPTTIAYRARYVGKQFNLGPYGEPAECTVTLQQ